jgi:hypothetical protein
LRKAAYAVAALAAVLVPCGVWFHQHQTSAPEKRGLSPEHTVAGPAVRVRDARVVRSELNQRIDDWISSNDPEMPSRVLDLLKQAPGFRFSDVAGRIRQSPDAEVSSRMLAAWVAVWMSCSPKDCLAWLEEQSLNPGEKELLLAHAYRAWSLRDGTAALDAAIRHQPSPNVFRSIFAGLAETDFQQAVDTYDSAPDSIRNIVVETMVLLAAERDPEAARRFLADFGKEFPETSDWIRLAKALRVSSPDLVDGWMATVEDPVRRGELAAGIHGSANPLRASAIKDPRPDTAGSGEMSDEGKLEPRSERPIGNQGRR